MQISDQKFTDYVKIVEDKILAVATLQPKLPLSVMVHTIVKEVYAVTEYTRFGTVILFEDNAELRWHHIDLLQCGKILATNSLKLNDAGEAQKAVADNKAETHAVKATICKVGKPNNGAKSVESFPHDPNPYAPPPEIPKQPSVRRTHVVPNRRPNGAMRQNEEECLRYLQKHNVTTCSAVIKALRISKGMAGFALKGLQQRRLVVNTSCNKWELATPKLLKQMDEHWFWTHMTDDDKIKFVNSLSGMSASDMKKVANLHGVSTMSIYEYSYSNPIGCRQFILNISLKSVYSAAAFRFFAIHADTGIFDDFYFNCMCWRASRYNNRKKSDSVTWEKLFIYYLKNDKKEKRCTVMELCSAFGISDAAARNVLKKWTDAEGRVKMLAHNNRLCYVLELVDSK